MGKGLLLGGVLASLVSLCFMLVACFVPMWLVLREEVANELCWWGEGMYTSRFWSGDDFETTVPKARCEDPLGIGPVSTWQAYCSNTPVPRLNREDRVDYAEAMCSATQQAKATSITTIVLLLLGIVLALGLLYWPSLNRRTNSVLLLVCMLVSAGQAACSFATWWIMTASPLFSYEHKLALSAQHADGIPFGSYASCSITSPFRSIPLSLFRTSSIQCLFPGPSYYATLFTSMLQMFAFIFFYYKRCELHEGERALRTMLGGGGGGSDDDVGGANATGGEDDDDDDDDKDVLARLRKARVYSMYGSMARRTRGFRYQFALTTLLPLALSVLHAALWIGFVVWGIQIIAEIQIYYAPPGVHQSDEQLVGDAHAALGKDMMEQIAAQVARDVEDGTRRKYLLRYTVNAFNFSPELAISLFMNNGAGLIGVFSFLSMFLLPISKSLAWLYFFFTPFDEKWKGWWLTALDFSGKWQLAYVFIMMLQAVGMSIHFSYRFPLLGEYRPRVFDSTLMLKGDVGMMWGGFGSVLLWLACVVSLALGQCVLFLHQKTVKWEERVRKLRGGDGGWADGGGGASPRARLRGVSPNSMLATPFIHHPVLSSSSTTTTTTTTTAAAAAAGTSQSGLQFQHLRSNSGSTERLNAIASAAADDEDEQEEEEHQLAAQQQRCAVGGSNSGPHGSGANGAVSLLHHFLPSTGRREPVECMCDRTFEPERGVKLRWTVLGKAVWWFLLFLIGGTFTFAQLVELVRIQLTDMNVIVIPNPRDRIRSISVFSSLSMVLDTSTDARPYHIAALMFVTLTLMPLARLLAAAYLWVLPLTARQQKRIFDFLEFSIAWSALEVFLVTLLVTAMQMPRLLGPLSGSMTPNATKFFLLIFPWMDGLMGADMELRPGFWFVATIVFVEKLVAGAIMAQAVTAMSERQLQSSLKRHTNKSRRARGGGHARVGVDGDDVDYAVVVVEGQQDVDDDEEEEGQALEAEAAAIFFSPAMRYNTSVLFAPSYLYAGIPRHWWTTWLVRGGLLGEASLVQQYGGGAAMEHQQSAL